MEKLSSGATTWVRVRVIGLGIFRGVDFELCSGVRRPFIGSGDCTGLRGLLDVAGGSERSARLPIGLGIRGAVSVEGNAGVVLAFIVGREALDGFSESLDAGRVKFGSRRRAWAMGLLGASDALRSKTRAGA